MSESGLPYYGELKKIGYLEEQLRPEKIASVHMGQLERGYFSRKPCVGEKFEMVRTEARGWWLTTTVTALYETSDPSWDKSVLPDSFPKIQKVLIPALRKGDIVFTTRNSVYILTGITASAPTAGS